MKSNKSSGKLLFRAPHNIAREMGRAIKEFDLIKEGDKIMIALSGGKDSLSLVHLMRYFQSKGLLLIKHPYTLLSSQQLSIQRHMNLNLNLSKTI